VRRSGMLPGTPDGRFRVYVATGGPGHLDPRKNDGVSWFAQGVRESAGWEGPLFHLFDSIIGHPKDSLAGSCHSVGLMVRCTGAPGHLDPRKNDGVSWFAQGVRESAGWEGPLFHLFDSIIGHPKASLVGICHSFGLMCRWSGVATPVLREEKSSGIPTNVLSDAGTQHPWFSRFSKELADHRPYRIIDNRLD